jgi:hypothetical protein
MSEAAGEVKAEGDSKDKVQEKIEPGTTIGQVDEYDDVRSVNIEGIVGKAARSAICC